MVGKAADAAGVDDPSGKLSERTLAPTKREQVGEELVLPFAPQDLAPAPTAGRPATTLERAVDETELHPVLESATADELE